MSTAPETADSRPLVDVVGVGTGAPEDITLRAARVLREADVVFTHIQGPGKQKLEVISRFVDAARLEPLPTPPRARWLDFVAAFAAHAERMAARVERGERVAFATLGDPGCASLTSFLDFHLAAKGIGLRYVPGVSYFSAATCAIGDQLIEEGDRMTVLRCPGDLSQLEAPLAACDTMVLYTVPDIVALRDFVRARKIPYAKIAIGLGRPDERQLDLRKAGPKTSAGAAVVVLRHRLPHMQSVGAAALNRELQPGAGIEPEVHHYTAADGTSLALHVHAPPEDAEGSSPRPGILLFHGGGWKNGSPAALAGQCQYLASLGFVAISGEYRIKSRFPDIDARDCASDAARAYAWMAAHADRLGIDAGRMVIGGGSSGGHIAACTTLGLAPGQSGPPDPPPRAMVLLNPVTDLGEQGFRNEAVVGLSTEVSPVDHVRAGLPPTLVLHGTDDRIVPYENSTRFADAMRAAGNDCRLVPYENRGHAWFNSGRTEFDVCYYETIRDIERFLRDIGVI